MNTRERLACSVVVLTLLTSACASQTDGAESSANPLPSASSSGFEGNDGEPAGTSFEERHQRDLMRCLREAGWELKYDSSNNTFLSDVPLEQQEARSADDERCQAEADAKNPARKLTDADYKSLYQQELKTMKCLEAEGYPPSEQPISEQQYISEYKAGTPSWQAYASLGPIPPEIEKKCPQPSVEQ